MLYRENDWAFVASLDGEEGYVPFSFCAEHHPLRSSSFRSQSSGGSREPSEQLGRDSRTSSELAPKRSEHSSTASSSSNHTQQQPSPTTPKSSMQSLHGTPERTDQRRIMSTNRVVSVDRMGDAGSPPPFDRDERRATPQGYVTTGGRRQTPENFPRFGKENATSADHHTTYTEVHVCPKVNNGVLTSSADSQALPFVKKPSGFFLVLYDFRECGEDEIPIARGEIITMLNDDDSDWAWVAKQDNAQGFVPRNFLCAIGQTAVTEPSPQATSRRSEASRRNHVPNGVKSKQRLLVLYDFQAQSLDQLTVFKGDVVVSSHDHSTTNGRTDDWVWVYSPAANRSGFIPANFAMPPASQ